MSFILHQRRFSLQQTPFQKATRDHNAGINKVIHLKDLNWHELCRTGSLPTHWGTIGIWLLLREGGSVFIKNVIPGKQQCSLACPTPKVTWTTQTELMEKEKVEISKLSGKNWGGKEYGYEYVQCTLCEILRLNKNIIEK